jgi:hypothetical protein
MCTLAHFGAGDHSQFSADASFTPFKMRQKAHIALSFYMVCYMALAALNNPP